MDKIDYSLSIKKIYSKALPATLFILAFGTTVFELLWHNLLSSLGSIWLRFYLFVPLLLALTLLHELLHLFGFWLLGKTKRKDWHIGMKSATPYAHCSAPIQITAYRVSVIIPGLLLGIFPLLLAFCCGWPIVFIYAILMTTGALGDLFILLNIRKLAPNRLVKDHASRPGCWLLIP
jgi:hypothetical protein